MITRLWILLVVLFASFADAAEDRNLTVSASKRVALVIGNAAYPGAAVLRNPVNDAIDIAAKLKTFGFDVTLKTDIAHKQMLRTLTEFGDKVSDGSEVLFFFAGHGMQVRGKNYLIPVDAEIRNEGSVSSEAVDVDQLLDKLAPARLSMVILDACRNNPFERRFRGSGQGLASINAPTGTLIAYATAPGKTAADGDGRNGLYTQELLAAMDTPGVKVEDVFKRVRGNVVKKSSDAQTPWESSSLTGDFYFIFQGPITVQVKPPTDPETSAWQAAESANSVAAYQVYLATYPRGRFVAAARIKLDALLVPADVSTSLPKAFSRPGGGRFVKEGAEWVEYPPYAPGKHFRFKELRADRKFIYLADETRYKDKDKNNVMLMRVPLTGGMMQWSFSNPLVWSDTYLVSPE